MIPNFPVRLDTKTKFLFSTSGSESSIVKHNTMLQSFSANIVYFTFSDTISSQQYANLLRSPMIQGGAVTGQGLKSGIVPHLDCVDDFARKLRSVNTVVNKEGTLWGYNTDAFGFETAIRQHRESSGIALKNAVIYGNGGVSGVAHHILCNLGIDVTMRGRNQEKVRAKMSELSINDFDGPFDLVVNATPVSQTPLSQAQGIEELLKGAKMVFDHSMPEKDGKRNFLAEACAAKGLYFIPGKDMYQPQMIKQWTLFLDGVVSAQTIGHYCETKR
jgi:shikimate dehydrogenase